MDVISTNYFCQIKDEDRETHKCDHCGKTFGTRGQLDGHVAREHMTEKLKCEHCPKLFNKPTDKRVHEQLHTKPFKESLLHLMNV